MKLIALADIHQMGQKWKSVVEVCQKEKPNVLAIAGDIFPKDNGITHQVHFVDSLKKYAQQIKDAGVEMVVILGNDDNQLIIPDMIQGCFDGLWHYVEDDIVEIEGYEFVGFPWVPDYPFGYKYWCKGEFEKDLRISPYQFMDPSLIDKDNKLCAIGDYEKYLQEKGSIHVGLQEKVKKVEDLSKSIWLIHGPPSKVKLDVCSNGLEVGSDAILKFVEKHQPLLTIHGHIHESPEVTGIWHKYINDTLCVQAGQVGLDLHYVTMDIEDKEIKNLKHSIYHE